MILHRSVLSLSSVLVPIVVSIQLGQEILQNQDKSSMIQEIHHIGHLDILEVEIVYVTHSSVGFLGFASFF